jgi:NADPH:quinone reductase
MPEDRAGKRKDEGRSQSLLGWSAASQRGHVRNQIAIFGLRPRRQVGGIIGWVNDVGVGEQQVIRAERRGLADALGDGPELARPTGGEGFGAHYGEEAGGRGARGDFGSAVARMVVHQDDMEIAGRALRGQRSDGAADYFRFIARGNYRHDARRGGRRVRLNRTAREFAPESAAEEEEVEPNGKRGSRYRLKGHLQALSRDNSNMRAWLMDGYDGVEKLRVAEIPDPQPGPGEILLRVRYAALNPADAFLCRGMYPAKPALPHILGRDAVGEVVATGPGVASPKVGESVGILRCDVGVSVPGTLAEMVVTKAASVAPIPPGWTVEEMAGAPLVFLTAWQALTQWGEPEAPPLAGSVLLVTGASGGVGVASVLLGKSMGLTVVGLSRSATKGEKLKELGADAVFNPDDRELRAKVAAAIAPKKVDLAVDNVGGALFTQLVAMLGYGGKISVVGRSAGPVPEFNTGTLFFRRNRIGGVAVADYTPEAAQKVWKEMVRRLAESGRRPVVDRAFPFEDVVSAFGRLAEGPMGKVVVRVSG